MGSRRGVRYWGDRCRWKCLKGKLLCVDLCERAQRGNIRSLGERALSFVKQIGVLLSEIIQNASGREKECAAS